MKTNVNTAILTTLEHRQFIEDLKARVATARISAARAVNRDLILFYWDIGRAIVEKQQTLGWGSPWLTGSHGEKGSVREFGNSRSWVMGRNTFC